MALETPRPYVRIDADIWDNEKIRELPPAAALGFIFAIAWAKDKRTDGLLSPRGVDRCGISPESLKALEDAELVRPLGGGDHWILVGWDAWQTTNAEIEEISAKRSKAGKASGRARAKNKMEQTETGSVQ